MDKRMIIGMGLGAALVLGLLVGIAVVSAAAGAMGGGMMGGMMDMGAMHEECLRMMAEHSAGTSGNSTQTNGT